MKKSAKRDRRGKKDGDRRRNDRRDRGDRRRNDRNDRQEAPKAVNPRVRKTPKVEKVEEPQVEAAVETAEATEE